MFGGLLSLLTAGMVGGSKIAEKVEKHQEEKKQLDYSIHYAQDTGRPFYIAPNGQKYDVNTGEAVTLMVQDGLQLKDTDGNVIRDYEADCNTGKYKKAVELGCPYFRYYHSHRFAGTLDDNMIYVEVATRRLVRFWLEEELVDDPERITRWNSYFRKEYVEIITERCMFGAINPLVTKIHVTEYNAGKLTGDEYRAVMDSCKQVASEFKDPWGLGR